MQNFKNITIKTIEYPDSNHVIIGRKTNFTSFSSTKNNDIFTLFTEDVVINIIEDNKENDAINHIVTKEGAELFTITRNELIKLLKDRILQS